MDSVISYFNGGCKMKNKRLVLAEFAYDYGLTKEQVENLIWMLLAEDDDLNAAFQQRFNTKLKGDK